MRLKNIFPNLSVSSGILGKNIKGISCDSRLLKQGEIFFIKDSEKFDIFSALKQIEDKVLVFVASKKDKLNIAKCNLKKPVIFVKDANKSFERAVDIFYGFNKNSFKAIGITGTKGKTTTAYLTYHLLTSLKEKTSMIGTIKYVIGDKSYDAINTTPGFISLRKILKEIGEKSEGYVVMEVSSHAIEQGRINGIEFYRCVFTNLSREHLDYHKTMDKYFSVKKSFFIKNKNSPTIINIDDKYGTKLLGKLNGAITYGLTGAADLRAKNIMLNKSGTEFDLSYKGRTFRVKSFLLGKHNILNILASVAVVHSLGFPFEKILKFVETFKGVEGRLQEVSKGIFVDYAHSPDSLNKALATLKDIGYNKIICVFGCGGNRDKGKRKIMGHIASRLAYFTFITSDNPRHENPLDICRQIEKGFICKNYSLILDREDAIANAVRMKQEQEDSCLLIAGKGHESYQIIGDKKISFKDSNIVKKILKKC